MLSLPKIHPRAVWFRWSAAPSENETAPSAAASGEFCPQLISAEQLKKRICFHFCSDCRVNTTPGERTAGYSSSPGTTNRIVCWVSAIHTCTKPLWQVGHWGFADVRHSTDGFEGLIWPLEPFNFGHMQRTWNTLILCSGTQAKLARFRQPKGFCRVCSQCNLSYT